MIIEYTKDIADSDASLNKQNLLSERRDDQKNDSENSENLLVEKIIDRMIKVRKIGYNRIILEMATHIEKMWKPDSTLRVFFFTDDKLKNAKVLKIADEWSAYCSIRFVETTDKSNSDIRISYDQSGRWSYIGTEANKVKGATMNFERLEDCTLKEFRRAVLHEFGHALGLIHEHQSPSIKINWDKPYVYDFCKEKCGWDKVKVDRNIFAEYDRAVIKSSLFDPLSIMAYNIPSEFTLDGITIPLNYDLSNSDKKHIGIFYP